MTRLRVFLNRMLGLFTGRRADAALQYEVQTHLDLLAAAHVRSGLSAEAARDAARRDFGGIDQVKERHRDRRGFPLLTELSQDIRHAFRLMARERWFTAATVLALSLGIGATTTMVTILYCMNVRGLPFYEATSLVGVTSGAPRSQGSQIPLGIFEEWRLATRSFDGLWGEIEAPISLGDDARGTDQFAGTYISFNAFALLRERPALGRDFLPEDDRAGAPHVALLGYRLWAERYGSDPSVLGRTIRLNGEVATVIGVMPEGFTYPIDSQIWRPLASYPALQQETQRPIRVVGRLARGVTALQAQSELFSILSTLSTVPHTERTRRIMVTPLNEMYTGKLTQPVPMMLLAAMVVLLLIACSHAASLLLARSSDRSGELSMRAALGAGRNRLIRQLLVESVLMAMMAGVFGVAIAWVLVRAFATEISVAGLPYWIHFSFDPTLAVVITALCIATGVAFGLLPAVQQSRTRLSDILNQCGRSGMASPRSARLSSVLIVGELVVTTILLSAASALMRSASVVYEADSALDLDNLWEFTLTLPTLTYPSSDLQSTFFHALDERMASAQFLESAALASASPFNSRDSRGVVIDGDRIPESTSVPQTQVVGIGPRYFDTLGLRLVRGTQLEDVDAASRATAALVNERFVARFIAEADPIGREIVLINNRGPDVTPRRFRIVGIAPALRQQQQAGHTPTVYISFLSQPAATASLIVRGQPQQFAAVVREQVRDLDVDLPVFNLRSLALVSYMSRFVQRITSTVFTAVAFIAMVLSALGLYSLTAHAAAQRRQEAGIRMALGAQRPQVVWLFLKRTLKQMATGLAIGMLGAVAVGFGLQGMLVDVKANQPLALAAIAAFVILVTAIAAVVPAMRTARLDPMVALRRN